MIKIPRTKLYLCGGAVRDKLLGRIPRDLDYVAVTDLTFDELVIEIKKIGTVFLAKPEFLTIRCKINNECIDIALPRIESTYSDGRHPDKVIRCSLKEDAARRDFTINAMYEDEEGHIIDYFGGQEDLKKRIIKTVGNPFDRFAEDYLRILRTVRFSVQLDFEIEINTYFATLEFAYNLCKIVPERIREELNKSLKFNMGTTIDLINKLGLWTILKNKGLTLQFHQL